MLHERPDSIIADSTLERKRGVLVARYRIFCDVSWLTRKAEIYLGDGRRLELESDGTGNWSLNKRPAPHLKGAIDVDITATPFTNTLPIRRLNLKRGQQQDILVAYIRLPDLAVTADPQRYTCIEPRRTYRFESSNGAFVRDIQVDDNCLIVDYLGLFEAAIGLKPPMRKDAHERTALSGFCHVQSARWP
jgi:hypothetical protein